MRIRAFIASLAMAVGLSGVAEAKYPEKPIKMIVAYSPGGSTDLTARLLAAYMEKYLDGATIIVENRPGAGGEIGFTALAQAAPDGYTIGFVNTPNVLSIPIERKVKYHWTQFELLGNVLDDPGGFSVNKDGPIKTLKDLVDFAKANPGKVTVGSSGVGSDDQLAMIAFEKIAGVKMTHVPFPGASAVKTAVSGGHIVVGGMNIGEAMQAVASGSPLINLGQMSEKRVDIAPDVPTFIEQGYPLVSASLRGVGAPKGLPAEIRDRLVDAVARSAADPEFQGKVRAIYAPLRYLDPAAHAKLFAELETDLQKLWNEQPWMAK